MNTNEILIQGLDLPVQIGVPDAERAGWQVLSADITLTLGHRFEEMGDDLTNTVDYEALTNAVKALASAHPRRLIETLAAEIAALVLRADGVTAVTVLLRKRILPGTDCVAVRIHRAAGEQP